MKMTRHTKAEPHVPFIALADIGWQIIIFFLVAASFTMNSAINLNLPSGTNQPQGQTEGNITLQATESTLTVDGRSVQLPELRDTLKSLLTSKSTEAGKAVVVSLKDDVTFQRNAEILYAIQKAGGTVIYSEDGQ